ncbi:MAG: hypothetical protein QGF00_26150 [Planctomycetota bacterium]|jgi:hypothetical protein|nr:hypothetical protein [Planctomycetota bacterium]MDP7253113.1 hypothetical protein [Planctomycetota bacterium]
MTSASQTVTPSLREAVMEWLDSIDEDHVSAEDLQRLRQIIERPHRSLQRLMYMHLTSLNPASTCVSYAIFEPDGEYRPAISADAEMPYKNVLAALADGWQVLQAPDPRLPFDDHEMDILGYQFILQKTEVSYENH